jgi:N-acetylmuramoyl-L-alanine amidase
MDSSLVGARIAIDPGHGPTDGGNRAASGRSEAEVTTLLALALGEELEARGAEPTLLRTGPSDPTPVSGPPRRTTSARTSVSPCT